MSECNSDSDTVVLIAEDDANDALLLERAIRRNRIRCQIQFVSDGEEAIAYLEGKEPYRNRQQFPRAKFIILDVKMPRRSGFDVLEWLQHHPTFHTIPTLVLSSSAQRDDVNRSYRLGAKTYMVKPGTFTGLERLVRIIHEYWVLAEKAELVNAGHHDR